MLRANNLNNLMGGSGSRRGSVIPARTNVEQDASREARVAKMKTVVVMQFCLWVAIVAAYTGFGTASFENFSKIAYKPSLPKGLGWKLSNLTRVAQEWYTMADDEQNVDYEISLTSHTVKTKGKKTTTTPVETCVNDLERYGGDFTNMSNPEERKAGPEDALGVMTRTFGKYAIELAKVRNRGNATNWKYEVEDVDIDRSACMSLYYAYFLGTTALATSTMSFLLALLLVLMTTRFDTAYWIGAYLPIAVTNEWEFPWMAKKINGDFGNTVGEDLVPKRKGFIQWVEVLSGGRYILDVIDVKKRVPMAVGYVAAYLSGVSGVLCIATSALVSEFHGHWYHYNWPWYLMGFSGFLGILTMNELITVVLMYVPLKVAVTLDNVPEGLWARKVEAGGMEGFTEKLLGIEFEQVGHEIRVTKSLGFASSRGKLTDSQIRFWNSGVSSSAERVRPKDVQYYGNNVQVGDVFLGIMYKKSKHTLLLPKTPAEINRDLDILEGYDLPGGFMENPNEEGQLIRFATVVQVAEDTVDPENGEPAYNYYDWGLAMTRRKVDGAVYEDVENPYELTAQELLDAKPELNLVLDPMHKEFDKRAIEDAMVVHLLARLENPLKEVEVPNVKEYKWLPRADASIEEAFDLIRQAIGRANPLEEEEADPVPFWLVMWRVNTEGVRDRLFPIENQLPGWLKKQVETTRYETRSRLIQYESLSQYVPDLGLEVMDLELVADNGHEVTEGIRVLSSTDYGRDLMIEPDDMIVGINYVPLTKNMPARNFTHKLLPKLPMPFVVNLAKKTGGPSTEREWEFDPEPNRFVKVLLSFLVVMLTFFLNSMALGSAEWTRLHYIVGANETHADLPKMPIKMSDFGVGPWYAMVHQTASVAHKHTIDLRLDMLVKDDEILGDRGVHLINATKFFSIASTVCGFFSTFLLGSLILMGVSQLASKVRTRYLVTSCVLNGLQALTSLIVVILWASVNREIKNIEPNCVIQYNIGKNHIVEWGDKEDHIYAHNGPPVCMKKFGLGMAWQGELVAAILALLISIDTFLALTKFAAKLSVDQKKQASNWLDKARFLQRQTDTEKKLLGTGAQGRYDIVPDDVAQVEEDLDIDQQNDPFGIHDDSAVHTVRESVLSLGQYTGLIASDD